MSLERDESVDLATARAVRLAGIEFYVAPLPLRQILAIADHIPKLSGITVETMSAARLEPIAEVVWRGLHRCHPGMTLDEFMELPITMAELMAALPVVIEQAGGRKADAAAGEVVAASASTRSTGESLPPNS